MTDPSSLRTRFDYIRHVSGYGPRCGCGGQSALHVGTGSPGEPGIFLCAECVTDAIGMFFVDQPEQPARWPRDEGRDDPYTDPRKPPASGIGRNEETLRRLHERREREKDLYDRLRDGDR